MSSNDGALPTEFPEYFHPFYLTQQPPQTTFDRDEGYSMEIWDLDI
jgi:hypothetical protein